MPSLAGNANLAAVQFDNSLGNRQSDACTLDYHALLPPSIELFKDHFLFHIIDSQSVIGDARHNFVILQLGGYVDGSVRG